MFEGSPSRAAVLAKRSAFSLPVKLQCAGIHSSITLYPSGIIPVRHSLIFTIFSAVLGSILPFADACKVDRLSVAIINLTYR